MEKLSYETLSRKLKDFDAHLCHLAGGSRVDGKISEVTHCFSLSEECRPVSDSGRETCWGVRDHRSVHCTHPSLPHTRHDPSRRHRLQSRGGNSES